MKNIFVIGAIISLTINQAFAYYTIEQIKYEQSIGSHETLDRVMENPKQAEKMFYNYTNNQNNYNNNSYDYSKPMQVQDKPLYKFGNSSEL